MGLQSKNAGVKCPDHGELDPGRKEFAFVRPPDRDRRISCGLHFASRCAMKKEHQTLLFYDVRGRTEKEGFRMENQKKNIITFQSSPVSSLKVLCTVALFVAMYTALSAVTIPLSPTLRISFAFLALAASSYFFGVWPNVIAAFACDFLGFLMNPQGGYVPFFALILMVKATIYAMSFYRRDKISVLRVIMTQLVVSVLCNILLNPLLLSVMYDMPYWSLAIGRVAKNAILLPVECFLLYLVLQLCIRMRKSKPNLFR